jgi:hypothetical protein
MNSETKIGIGMVALVVLCCAGPLVLSLVATGAVLGALGASGPNDVRCSSAAPRSALRCAVGLWHGATAMKLVPNLRVADSEIGRRPSEPPLMGGRCRQHR